MNRLVFLENAWDELRRSLTESLDTESATALFVAPGRGLAGMRYIVTDVAAASADDYSDRSRTSAQLRPEFVARALKRARRTGESVWFVHTHPDQAYPSFSAIDRAGELVLAPALYRRAPNGTHGAVVIGTSSFCAHALDSSGLPMHSIDQLLEVGRSVRLQFALSGAETEPSAIYDRNVRALGRAGQQLLARLSVGVVGVGGTGSVVVEQLARLGVGHLVLVDNELLEETNLNRVLGSTHSDVGRPKVEIAAAAATRANPNICVNPLLASVIEERGARPLLDCDFIFCCTDSHGSRAVVNQLAYQYGVPTIDIGIRIDASDSRVQRVTTRVQMLAAGLPCLACHSLLDPVAVRRDLSTDATRNADPYIVGHFEPQPAVISINSAPTSDGVTMFLGAMLGLPVRARHIIGRPLDGIVRSVESTPTPGCVVCGIENARGRGDLWSLPWLPNRGG